MTMPAPVADPTALMVAPVTIEASLTATNVPSPVPVAPVTFSQLPSSTAEVSSEPVRGVADTSATFMAPIVSSGTVPPVDLPDDDDDDDVDDLDVDESVDGMGDSVMQGGAQTQLPNQKSSSSKKKKSAAQVTVTMATAAASQSGLSGMQGENTGRWTAEEHRLFLQGLELHGKGWKKIASLIKSRTVVQIRTHAQKYFQKLAKAKQNGEEGEILMEGRGGTTAVPSVTTSAAQTNKRRKQTSGTKRKAIQSVVASALRQGKKQATAQSDGSGGGVVTSVAPALAPYILPPVQNPVGNSATGGPQMPPITTSHGTISGAALEDSIFRYLTPEPASPSEPQLHEIARQAGANPITLPTDQPHVIPAGGEISPTGVADYTMYPSWTMDAKDTPSWYAKGTDVDALLDVGDNLDWLEDTGDLNETYEAAAAAASAVDSVPLKSEYGGSYHDVEPNRITHHEPHHYTNVSSLSMNTLPRIDSGAEVVVPPLPSLFGDGIADTGDASDEPSSELILQNLKFVSNLDDHLQVFDTPIDEHDFVSTILDDDNVGESSATLSLLVSS